MKKIAIVASFYAVSLTALTWVIVYFLPSRHIVYSLSIFYGVSILLAFVVSYYLFFSDVIDIDKGKKILIPANRDITKRKILLVTFIYSVFFILMFIYEQVSLITFALWPIIVYICLLMLLDRRLIFGSLNGEKVPEGLQKYGIRFLMTLSTFSSMWFLGEYMTRRTSPLPSKLLAGWESIDISVWVFPIALISSLVIADWITTLIIHDGSKNFFKRTDIILFFGIQAIVAIFLFIV